MYARHCPKGFAGLLLFTTHNNPTRWVVISSHRG